MAALVQTQSYPSGLGLEDFKRELGNPHTSLEDKFNLLRSQFPQDPTLFDASGHQSQSLGQTAALSAMVGALTPLQIELITLLLHECATQHSQSTDENITLSQVRPIASEGSMLMLPQIQSLLQVLAAKVFSLQSFQEIISQSGLSEILNNAQLVIGDWCQYLIVMHSQHLKPNFAEKIMQKVAEVLQHLVNHKEKEGTFMKSQLGQSTAMIAGGAGQMVSNDNQGLKDLIYSAYLLTVGLVQSKLQETALVQLLLPLFKTVNLYDSFTFLPFTPPKLILSQPPSGKSSLLCLTFNLSLQCMMNSHKFNNRLSKNGTFPLLRYEKFNQTLVQLMNKVLYTYCKRYLETQSTTIDEGMIVATPTKKDDKAFPLGMLSENTQKDLQSIQTPTSYLDLDTGNREAQQEWLNISQACLSLAVESFKSLTPQGSGLTQQTNQLGMLIFDLFKVTLHMASSCKLVPSEEHFVDTQDPLIKQLSDIVENQNLKCPIIRTFQIVYDAVNTSNEQAFTLVFTQFEFLLSQRGFIPDLSNYILSLQLVFLDKLCSSFQFSAELFEKDTSLSLIISLLNLYSECSQVSDHRLYDIETSDFLTKRTSYRTLMNKFRQLEIRNSLQSAVSTLNKALSQQLAFELISYFSHYKEKYSEACLKHITQGLATCRDEYSSVYILLKLSVQVMSRGEGHSGNKGYHEILVTGVQWPRNQLDDSRSTMLQSKDSNEFVSWQVVENFKSSDIFIKFWHSVSEKVRTYLINKAKILREKSIIPTPQSARTENLIQQHSQPQEDGLLSDHTFTAYKRLYIYGTLNLEMFNIMYPTIKEILRDVKDFEHSFEVKLAVHSMLVICKDRENDKHKEILKSLVSLIRYLYDYISMIDVKYGNQKPPPVAANTSSGQSSARRQIDGELSSWEQERVTKVKQIKNLVGQAISIIAHYIDFKERRLPSNLAFLEDDSQRSSSQPRQLEMMTTRKEYFDQVLASLKKIILRSHMHGGYLVEQLLRVFFYERRELQNLCLINSGSGNEYLIDVHSKGTLEWLTNFVVEATDVMQVNATSLVRSFVSQLHARLLSNIGRQHLHLLKFAKSLTQGIIKQLKKVMIFLREREDTMKETCTQMKEIIVKTLAVNPNGILYKEFFTFLREIFYYNRDMDQVDFDLACDTLEIHNTLLKTASQSQVKETLGIKQSSFDHITIQDYFMFSDMAPGVILSETFKVPQDSFTVSLLFKINLAQIHALQERTGKQDHQLTFFQILDKTNSDGYPPLQIIFHILKDRMKIYDYDVKLDENWHCLTVLFDFNKKTVGKSFHKIKIFIDSLYKRINQDRPLQHTFHKSHEQIFTYGVDATDMMVGATRPATSAGMQSHQISLQFSQLQPFVVNNDFKPVSTFQGSLSLPFMFTKFEVDKQNEVQKRAIQDFLIECLSRKQTVGVTSLELAAYLKWRGKLQGKDNTIAPFESHEFNEEVIIKHQRAVSIDHLGAIHQVMPHEAMVVLGGYKMMYPLFEKSMQSNLSYTQKADIWRHLFKILRTYMNIDPSHVLRLYKNKYLIQTLKSCLIRGAIHHKLLTKELLTEVLNIAKDSQTNRQADLLEDFYKKYVFDVLLDESFCDLYFIDLRKGRRTIIFEEVAECMSKMFGEEDVQREKHEKIQSKQVSQQIGQGKRKLSDGPSILIGADGSVMREFFSLGTARDIYKLFMKLIIRYQEAEFIKHTKKLAMIMMKIILRDQQRENFTKLIDTIQTTEINKKQHLSKATLLAMLKIFEGVIKHPQFNQSPDLYAVLKQSYKRDCMDAHLNQSSSYGAQMAKSDESHNSMGGRLEDDIIAITLRIIIDVQIKLSDQPKTVLPPRHQFMGENHKSAFTFQEERSQSITQLYRCLTQNPKGIYLQKTLCSLIITALERKQKLKVRSSSYTLSAVKYNAQFLKECLKERDLNNLLEIMRTQEFDHELFGLTIKLFKWYDLETKKIYLEFYRQLIEDQSQSHNIQELSTFKDKKFLDQMRLLLDPQQETYLLNIVMAALKDSKEPEVLKYAELIVSSMVKGFFNPSLQTDIDGIIYEEEIRTLKTIKKLFILLEPYEHTLLQVLADTLKYVQEVVNWVWSYILHDTNRTNLNLKLVLFLQLVEETFMKKLGQNDQNRIQQFLNDHLLYEVYARLMIVFEDTKIIYFDYPNPSIIETNKRNTIVTGIIRQKESLALREVTFTLGGPLRIFLSLLFQTLRKIKPYQDSPFNTALELTRYYLFKEDSSYVTSFRPVPTIEPTQTQASAPLFKMMFNANSTKRNQYVLQPVDLTRQFIEMYNDTSEYRESIALTLGFLPLILLNELHEVIKRKHAHQKSSTDEGLYDGQIIGLMGLMREVMRQSYVSEEIKESIGYVLLTITDPRLKEELYTSLNPIKLMQRGRLGASAKPYFLSKASEFVDQIRQNTEIGARQMGSEVETPGGENHNQKGLQTVMRDGHFRQSANPDQIDYLASRLQEMHGEYQKAIPESQREDQDEEGEDQLFNDADLDPIKKAEEKDRFNTSKDYTLYQEELITLMNKCYSILELNPDGDQVIKFRDEFLGNPRVDEIMQACRMVSSEKFRHVHSYSFGTREEHEIKRQLKQFQLDHHGPDSARQESVRTHRQVQITSLAALDGSPEGKPLRILDSDGNGNFTPFMMESQTSGLHIPKTARKRSADDTNDNAFEFQSSNEPTPFSQTGSQGKVSLASSSRFHLGDNMSVNTRGGTRSHRTLEYYYSKQQYQKTVKLQMEEPQSIWYDNLEQMKKDYADMKEIYDIVNSMQVPVLEPQTPNVGAAEMMEEAKKITQPASNNGYKPRQYEYFVRQRKATDMWGRCMLMKPDRKYKQRKFLISHKYFVHDILKNLFAVSLLDDSDFPDYQQMLETLEKQEEQKAQAQGENPQMDSQRKLTPQSEQFKRLRELLLQKIEQNDFLYTLLSNPEAFMNDDHAHFDFHPITSLSDPTIIWSSDAQLISVEGGLYGEMYLSSHYLMFKAKNTRVDPEILYALQKDQVIRKKNKVWHIGQLEQVFKRRFALLQQAFEIYTREKKSYFFNLLTEESCVHFFSKIQDVARKHNKHDKSRPVQIIEKPKAEFKQRNFVNEWAKGEKSTQEFLLLVNKYSGRSYNDFSQYPVFPWILSDYSCSYNELLAKTSSDKEDNGGFRDLTKNSGILSEQKLEVAKTQFAATIEGDGMIYGNESYHLKFGFSNRMFSLGYLLRMEPFTDNFIEVNGGLDNPDRIFYSFKDQWKSLLEDKQNNSELIPEFFYLPEMFRNHNLSNLGRSRSGHSVNEVELPAWAKNEHDFVRVHREMLESKVIQSKLRYWIDLMFGTRQMDETACNVFYCYAYENYVKPRKDELQIHHIHAILEFLQVPQQIFSEPLFKIDKKQPQNIMYSQALQNIEEEADEYEENSQMYIESKHVTPVPATRKQDPRIVSSGMGHRQQNKLANKISTAGRSQALGNSKSTRDFDESSSKQPMGAGAMLQDFKNSSLIQKFIECAASQNRQRHENEMKKIQESHKIDKPEERNIFHMAFSLLNGRCFVFLADKDSGSIRCVACRESFLQEELKNPCNLGLKLQNLRGDFHNIFQLYGGGLGDRSASSQRSPLLFTCQNLDNSIKIYDLSIKKGSLLVHQERTHNNMVTAIKFSSDFKYFISGDMDGVIHHYQRITDEQQQEDMQGSMIQPGVVQSNRYQMPENNVGTRCFPFTLKFKFQDQFKAILAIETNYTLDMYVTASRDGTVALRCLRSSQLWKVIPLEKLQAPSAEVLTLKLSLHGYIVIMMKESSLVYTFVYSINGDLLVSTKRECEQFEFKYAQLTANEDNMIMVFNQKLRKEDKEMHGVIRVSRLFDLEKEPKRDNLQRTFYPMIHQIIYPSDNGKSVSKALQKRETQMTGDLSMPGSAKYIMPSVLSFALSQDESKMNLFLKTGEIICFDESRSKIIEQLDDFGLA